MASLQKDLVQSVIDQAMDSAQNWLRKRVQSKLEALPSIPLHSANLAPKRISC